VLNYIKLWFWGTKIKAMQVKMLAIASLLAVAGTFPVFVMAADASGTLTVSAFVEPACNTDNTSLNFSVNQTVELKSANRVAMNSVGSQGAIPLSVTCKNSALYQTYSTTLAGTRALINNHVVAYTDPTNQISVTISY
jgi:hypothetical protein